MKPWLLALALALAACGGDDGADDTPGDAAAPDPDAAADAATTSDAAGGPVRVTARIGAAGGTLAHPSGASLTVPPGALGAEVELSIAEADPPAAIGAGRPLGRAYVLGPAGQTFAAPVALTLPLAEVPAEGAGVFIAPDDLSTFAALPTTAVPEGLRAETLHFSVVVVVTPPGSLVVTTDPNLPPAVVGAPYGPVALEASGGTPPYAWTLTGGSLPGGLTLSAAGVLEGTPIDTASPRLQVRVTDALGLAVEIVLRLTVTTEPLPTLDALDPATAPAGSPAFTLRATGADFELGDVVRWGGAPLPTTFVDATTLEAAVGADALLAAAVVEVDVERPGVGATAPLPFTITGGGAAPVLSALDPDEVPAGAPDTQIRVLGQGFTAAAVVRGNAQPLATGFVADGELTAVVPAAMLANAGIVTITVTDAGGPSNALPLTVGAPSPNGPVIRNLNRPRIFIGAPDTRVNIAGERFDPAAVVTVDGAPVAAEFHRAELVIATIPAAVLAVPGAHAVRVENPLAAGGASAPANLESVPLPFLPPVVLAAAGGAIYGVAADVTAAHWVDWNTGDVWEAPLAGGPPVRVAMGQARPFAVASDATHVYWTNEAFGVGQGSVARAPRGGGAVEVVASGLSGPHRLVVDATHAYFSEEWSGRVGRAPLAGGDVEPLATQEGVGALDVDATHVWFAAGDRASGLLRLAKDAPPGTAPDVVARNQAAYDIDVGAERVWWTEPFRRNVSSVPLAGGNAAVFAPGLGAPHFLAEHAGYVFFGDRGNTGLFAAPVGGGEPVLVEGTHAPWDIAESAAGVVVSNNHTVFFLADAP